MKSLFVKIVSSLCIGLLGGDLIDQGTTFEGLLDCLGCVPDVRVWVNIWFEVLWSFNLELLLFDFALFTEVPLESIDLFNDF